MTLDEALAVADATDNELWRHCAASKPSNVSWYQYADRPDTLRQRALDTLAEAVRGLQTYAAAMGDGEIDPEAPVCTECRQQFRVGESYGGFDDGLLRVWLHFECGGNYYRDKLAEANERIAVLRHSETEANQRLAEAHAERDEARGCPHGDNCGCAIGTRHSWWEAYCRLRSERNTLKAEAERQKCDKCGRHVPRGMIAVELQDGAPIDDPAGFMWCGICHAQRVLKQAEAERDALADAIARFRHTPEDHELWEREDGSPDIAALCGYAREAAELARELPHELQREQEAHEHAEARLSTLRERVEGLPRYEPRIIPDRMKVAADGRFWLIADALAQFEET